MLTKINVKQKLFATRTILEYLAQDCKKQWLDEESYQISHECLDEDTEMDWKDFGYEIKHIAKQIEEYEKIIEEAGD